MSRTVRSFALAVVATFVVAGAASAAQAAKPTPQTTASSSMKSAKAASHSIKGTLEKFDATGNMITVHTSKGAQTLALDPGAHIMQGGRSVAASDLAAHAGSKVEVKYTEANGQKTAQAVRLAPETRASAKSGKGGKKGR